jgi:hypothetical protein
MGYDTDTMGARNGIAKKPEYVRNRNWASRFERLLEFGETMYVRKLSVEHLLFLALARFPFW